MLWSLLCSYLGNYEELVQLADAAGGEYSNEQVRDWLRNREQKAVLASMGLTEESLGACDIDHILPGGSKGGANHPCNYYVMPATDNRRFSCQTTSEKCMYVGLGVVIRVIFFHVPRLPQPVIATKTV